MSLYIIVMKTRLYISFFMLFLFISCKNEDDNNLIDSDNDGIADENDFCLNTPAGFIVDESGCRIKSLFDENYFLIWNDEFSDEGSPDSSKWHYQIIPPNNGSWFNDEKQHYTNNIKNSYVSDGTMKIKSIKEIYNIDGSIKNYTSARLNSKFAFQYGRVDVKAKLPSSKGTWPAIWTLGTNINELGNYFGNTVGNVGWPKCGEIDIMEHVGYDPNHVFFSMHNANLYGDIHGTNQQGIYELEGIENDFHTYSVEWDSSFVRAYFDGNLFFNYPKPEIHDINSWPYDNPFFLIINLAIGGEWGGQQGIDNSIFPATFTIDYVRIFKKTDL